MATFDWGYGEDSYWGLCRRRRSSGSWLAKALWRKSFMRMAAVAISSIASDGSSGVWSCKGESGWEDLSVWGTARRELSGVGVDLAGDPWSETGDLWPLPVLLPPAPPPRRLPWLCSGTPPSLWTVRSWRSRRSRRTKVLRHLRHLKGRSFVWDRSWRLRCSLRLKAQLQNWHLYLRSGADDPALRPMAEGARVDEAV